MPGRFTKLCSSSPHLHSLLRHERKDAVVLYVGNENPARHVYDKVGFVGLGSSTSGQSFKLVEDWLELGFDQNKIELGHW